MRYIQFPEADFRNLNLQLANLYKYFSKVCADILSEDNRVNTPSSALASEVAPYSKYHYSDAVVDISIHQHRDGFYSLDCRGIILTRVPYYKPRSKRGNDYRYQNYYGEFKDLPSVVTSFNTVVKQYINGQLGDLF